MMKPDYGRTTITVPWDLKKRMKKARAKVNWSAIACQAFEEKLEELGPIEEITSIEEALKRMKAIKEEHSSNRSAASQTGKEAGIHWAMNFARPGQLKRIEELRDGLSDKKWDTLLSSREGWKELAVCIEPRMAKHEDDSVELEDADERQPQQGRDQHRGRGRGGPRHHRGPGGARQVWRSILDSRPDHPGFLQAFAEGALEVWSQIKDKL